MFAENVAGRPARYAGCGPELATGYDAVIRYMERMHKEAVAVMSTLQPYDLGVTCAVPGGAAIPRWKWLRAMVEHEVHHRGQLYLMLAMLNVATPPLYGLTSEQVKSFSVS